MCGCYSVKYPMVKQSPACSNQSQYDCGLHAIDSYFETTREECEKDCPLECDGVRFDKTLSSLSFPSDQWISFYQSFYNSSRIKEDVLALDIYLENPEYTKIIQSPKLTPYDLLAQIGGSLGMFLSLSIFTFVELAELTYLCLFALLKKEF